MTRARDGLKRFASEFTYGQKAVTVVAAIALVVGAAVFMSFSAKPNYTPLFTGLKSADAANVVSKLTSDKVPYQLADNGTTIMVPASDVDQERITLAQAGLPATSTVGLSLLDKEGVTTSNMTQQADYLQALQGELEQTIDSIQNVTSSQVNIAMPANQDFALSNNSPTGASVLVTMRAGQTLTDGEVQAIVHLVGSSIPNLPSSGVTVADSNGNLLAGPGVSQGEGGANSQTDAYDQGVQAKVEAYLAAALGQSNADVQVNATLSYDQVSTTTQNIIPGPTGQPQSFCTQTSQSNQSYTGSGTPPGGPAGTVTTTPATVTTTPGGATTGTGNGNYVNTQNTQTCETNQETKTVQQAPGTVVNQSVAVLVNSKAIPKGLSLTALQGGVAAAAGIDAARGDQLAFSSMPFDTVGAQQAAKAAAAGATAAQKQAMTSLIRTGVVFLVIAIALFLLWRSARKARRAQPAQVLGPSELAALSRSWADEPTGQLPAVVPDVLSSREAVDANRFIDSQPDDVATMLRSWLSDTKTLSS
ncbi:MAG TPA: flagellar basal-body MS-ring/collar protein FliF [Acidimicrobiales bacterium]|nr:flagellar basal-body MS-ring/collar protein FliF [Acidimicrobiales bacterium]